MVPLSSCQALAFMWFGARLSLCDTPRICGRLWGLPSPIRRPLLYLPPQAAYCSAWSDLPSPILRAPACHESRGADDFVPRGDKTSSILIVLDFQIAKLIISGYIALVGIVGRHRDGVHASRNGAVAIYVGKDRKVFVPEYREPQAIGAPPKKPSVSAAGR